MNNKIKELADQCTTVYDTTTIPVEQDFDIDKFAYLILQECIDEFNSVKVYEYGKDDYDKGYDDGLQQAIEVIEEKFGFKSKELFE